MSNGAFEIHTHTRHSQGMLGKLVQALYNKTDRSASVNYNRHILVLGDVHRLLLDIKTKKQKINNFDVLN